MATILCVEDETYLREYIAEELEDRNYTALQAEDGKQGLEMILKHKPDLVLCDIDMPNMDGYQLQFALRGKHPEFADVPFIFLTALVDKDEVLAGMRSGADAYLTKPIDYAIMITTIEASLSGKGRHVPKEKTNVTQSKKEILSVLGVKHA